jgi:hypothetical protein
MTRRHRLQDLVEIKACALLVKRSYFSDLLKQIPSPKKLKRDVDLITGLEHFQQSDHIRVLNSF